MKFSRRSSGTGCGDLLIVGIVFLAALIAGAFIYYNAFKECIAHHGGFWYCLAILD